MKSKVIVIIKLLACLMLVMYLNNNHLKKIPIKILIVDLRLCLVLITKMTVNVQFSTTSHVCSICRVLEQARLSWDCKYVLAISFSLFDRCAYRTNTDT